MNGTLETLSIEEKKELAASGLETSKIISDAARRKYDKGEISFDQMQKKLKFANDYYFHRLEKLGF